jgi:type II secretory pathway component PulJ
LNRRGFTIIELMIAGMMATIVLGGITVSLSQLGSAKAISRQRLEAFSRCDNALRTIRRDTITVLRRGDLFATRVFISDSTGRYDGDMVSRDELLIFNGNLRANKEIDFNGEGFEYETQFRIEDNDTGVALWKRRDPILDDNPTGGGIATPISEGIVAIELEAFDGTSWFRQWDSDESGIPVAIRITVTSSGMEENDISTTSVTLRTIVPLDRVRSPDDKLVLLAQLLDEERVANGDFPGEGGGLSGNGAGAADRGETDDSGSGEAGGGVSSGNETAGGTAGNGGINSAGGRTTTFVAPDGTEIEIPIE